jgi:hypothetical protein
LVGKVLEKYPHLPYLNIETDGSAFPQQIEIRLEAFALQVKRVNDLVRELKGRVPSNEYQLAGAGAVRRSKGKTSGVALGGRRSG